MTWSDHPLAHPWPGSAHCRSLISVRRWPASPSSPTTPTGKYLGTSSLLRELPSTMVADRGHPCPHHDSVDAVIRRDL